MWYYFNICDPPDDSNAQKMSNQLNITLPLDTVDIKLPAAELRLEDEDLYREYVALKQIEGMESHWNLYFCHLTYICTNLVLNIFLSYDLYAL